MTTPHNTHSINEAKDQLWIFGLGTMYLSKNEANKHKDQCCREYLKGIEFFGQIWWQRYSSWAIKDAKKMGYNFAN